MGKFLIYFEYGVYSDKIFKNVKNRCMEIETGIRNSLTLILKPIVEIVERNNLDNTENGTKPITKTKYFVRCLQINFV